MGGATFNAGDWATYTKTTNVRSATSHTEVFKANRIKNGLNPNGVTYRESCDSEVNPKSTPVIVGLDVTASMGKVSFDIAQEGLNTLAKEIYDKKPISDPHIMFMGIGDVVTDDSPLQVTQFEAGFTPLTEQLLDLYIEQGGGGNGSESYTLPWYFASKHTKIDSMKKRGKKGYLFTIGDDAPNKILTKGQIESVLGYNPERDFTGKELLTMVSRDYEVFHLHITRYNSDMVLNQWRDLLGERALKVTDHKKIPEIIVATLQVLAGDDKDAIANGWSGDTSIVVKEAIKGLDNKAENNGLVNFD